MGRPTYEELAERYVNEAIFHKAVASVHIENEEDELFWDAMLQKAKPGKYNFIAYSKSKNQNDTRGCEQCLKYLGYLSDKFFICIDSDMRNLVGDSTYTAADKVAQTYAYSWENHCCHIPELQALFSSKCANPKHTFDFNKFLKAYSKVLYKGLLLIIHESKSGDNTFLAKFLRIMPNQCVTAKLVNNGEQICNEIKEAIEALWDDSGQPDLKEEEKTCTALGITSDNAYMYMRGHNIYDFIESIGRTICKVRDVSFKRDVLNSNILTVGYREVEKIQEDLKAILK